MKRTLGVCYYPEHWAESQWAVDAARMAKLGLTWVRIGEFAWGRMEPTPGTYDWDWLDRAIDTLGKAGLKVVLGTPTATPPRWMLTKHPDMLAVGIDRAADRGIDGLVWTEANAETLQFPDKSFDAYTIAFGIRNVTDIPKALREAHRVLKRGGRFFCLEFSTTAWPGFGDIYDTYSHNVVPKIGQMIAGDEDSYRYLIESIRRFPDMPTFEWMIADAGFVQTKVEPMLGGLVAIHSGWKI